MTKTIRRAHRWLGLLIGIQLLAWTGSGLYFSWNDIETVRGEHTAGAPAMLAASDTVLAGPGRALAALHDEHPEADVRQVVLRRMGDALVYEVALQTDRGPRYALADARTGTLRPALSAAEARALAEADFTPDAPVQSVEHVTTAPEGSEYRGGPLPAYRVTFDHPSGTRLYVSAERGRVEARRNDTWRWFDWLWMLHIMDYDARSDFNTLLLQAFSVLGLVTVASGFLLGGVTSPWLRGRRRTRPVRTPPEDAGVRPAEGP